MTKNVFTDVVMATEPHDQIALIITVILLVAGLYFRNYVLYFIVAAIVLVVGVLVDLTAHGWDH